MRKSVRNILLSLALLAASSCAPGRIQAQQAGTTAYPGIGKGARIFVTKAHPSHGDLSDAEFRKLSDAGFTVAVSLWAEHPRVFAERAAKAGLSSMNWNLGLVDKKNDIDRTVTRQGKPTKYTTPASPVAWGELTSMVVDLARLSLENPSFQAVALDFEIYDGANLDGFCESYDDQSFRTFLLSAGHEVPNPLPAPDKRWEWLHNKSLLQMYVGYQIDQVAVQAKAMRKAIDAVNPRFQIGIYGWGVLMAPVTHALATAQAPALVMDATAYGRTIYPYDAEKPDRDGLKWTVTALSQIRDEAYKRYDNVIFLGGHYPHAVGPEDGSQFKFTARQAFNSAAYNDGYWIWTDWETPPPWKDRGEWHDAMVAYFRLANAALEAGDYMWSAREPEAILSPNAKAPQSIVTSGGKNRIVWDPRAGKRINDAKPQAPAPAIMTALQDSKYKFEIQGSTVEARPKDVPAGPAVKRYAAGSGLAALAIGEADGLPGDELITLSAGWVKIWDIESQAQLARFYVGADQKSLGVAK